MSADELRSRWSDVLDAVRDVRKTAWILLSNYASIDTVEGNVVTMAFDTEGNAKGFASSGSDGYLADVLERMFGARPVIRAIVNPAAAGGGGRGAVRAGRGLGPCRRPLASGPASGLASGPATQVRQRCRRRERRSARTGPGGPAPLRAAHRIGAGQRDSGRGAGSGAAGRARGQPRPGSVAAGMLPGPPEAAAVSAVADDPRPFTDAVPDGGNDLTGTDLIMRELGGRVIDEA